MKQIKNKYSLVNKYKRHYIKLLNNYREQMKCNSNYFSKTKQERTKQFYIRENMKKIHRALALSGIMFKLSPLFQYLITNAPQEIVLKNCVSQAYNSLKGKINVWYGCQLPEMDEEVENKLTHVRNVVELQKFVNQNQNLFEIHIYAINQQKFDCTYISKIKELQNVSITFIDLEQLTPSLIQSEISAKIFPSYNFISITSKEQINRARLKIYWVLSCMNFKNGRQDFIDFFQYYCDKQSKSKVYVDQYKQMTANLFRSSKKQIYLYSKNGFYCGLINTAMRSLSNPEDFGYFRFPINRLFYTIVELFVKQSQEPWRRKQFKCYRGCYLKWQDLQNLKLMEGHIIQMEGFLSTSMNEKIAKGFGTTLFTINVPSTQKMYSFFNCFASVQHLSFFYAEEEIIFNPLNFFRIKKVCLQKKTLELDYIVAQNIIQNQNDLDEQKNLNQKRKEINKNFLENFRYQKQVIYTFNTQGELLMRRDKERAELYYCERIIRSLSQAKNYSDSQIITSLKMDKNHIFSQKMAKILFNCLKKLLSSYEWHPDQEINLRLIKNMIGINIMKYSLQIFFFLAIIKQYFHQQEEAIRYLFVSLAMQLQVVGLNALGTFFNLMNIARNCEHLDFHEICQQIYETKKLQFLETTNHQFIITQLIFLLAPFLYYNQIDSVIHIQKYKKLILKLFKINTKIQDQNMWVELLEKRNSFIFMRQFKKFYYQNYNNPILWIYKLFYQSLLTFQMSSIRVKKQERNYWIDELFVSLDQFLINSHQFLNVFHSGFKMVIAKILLTWSIKTEIGQKFVEEYEKNQLIKDGYGSYFEFRIEIVNLSFLFDCYLSMDKGEISEERNKNYWNYLKNAINYLSKNFKHHNYAHFLLLLNMCQYCLKLNKIRSFKYFFKLLGTFWKKIKTVLKWQKNRFNKIIQFSQSLRKKIIKTY